MTHEPTDNTTPRLVEATEWIVDDMLNVLYRLPTAVRCMNDWTPGYPSAPSSTVARPIECRVTERGGVWHWRCPLSACALDHRARGARTTQHEATQAFHAHWNDTHGEGASTQPERHAAILGHDAIRDMNLLRRELAEIARRSRRARDIADKWGITRIGLPVADPRDDEWCPSCIRVNEFIARRKGGKLCPWCDVTLRELNKIRAGRGEQPITTIPEWVLTKHHTPTRLGRATPVTATDMLEASRTEKKTKDRRKGSRKARAA